MQWHQLRLLMHFLFTASRIMTGTSKPAPPLQEMGCTTVLGGLLHGLLGKHQVEERIEKKRGFSYVNGVEAEWCTSIIYVTSNSFKAISQKICRLFFNLLEICYIVHGKAFLHKHFYQREKLLLGKLQWSILREKMFTLCTCSLHMHFINRLLKTVFAMNYNLHKWSIPTKIWLWQ